MGTINPFNTTGWKKSARVNCTILVLLSISMIILSGISLSHGAQTALLLYSGDCNSGNATAINLALHLLINAVSTLVVLNSPSREDINRAHSKGAWLDIGVSSIRNTLNLSRFKRCILALSSVPIHLLFNSTVFKTDYRGASLQFPGLSPHGSNWSDVGDHCSWAPHFTASFYGSSVSSSEYFDKDAPVLSSLSALATQVETWKKLDINECRQVYASCRGMKKYGDVILVANKPGGWIRDNMWDLGKDQRLFWDKYIPPKQANHLFFDAQCNIRPATTYNSPGGMHYAVSEPRRSALDISIDHCLAKPLETACQVAVSPILLLLVTIFVAVKTFTAILITISLGQAKQVPLITHGDAIASFITKPDNTTIGYCTIGYEKIHSSISHSSVPRPWHGSKKRWAAAIPWSTWVMSYSIIIIGISFAIGLFIIAAHSTLNGKIDQGGFFPSDNSPLITLDFSIITAVVLANSPQLLLTFCYFAYNNIFTHLQSALEWAQFGIKFSPLRVTDPKGQQLSTYRLQLPYRYSLCLITFRYYFYDVLRRDTSLPPDAVSLVGYSPAALLTLILVAVVLALIPPIWSCIRRLPPNIVIPGCNSLAFSAACHVSRPSYDTTDAGAFRDATPSPPLAPGASKSGSRLGGRNEDIELLTSSMDGLYLEKLVQSKLRWGVIDMPPKWYAELDHDPALVGHLGFSTLEAGGVAAPLWGHLYA
ncbi:hypothetical protein F5B22DRAFT_640008 [Xylaria bambusicola]|uniref:uncharacterized protein n=1 Tax=Xylaria bambusicola TaxID=326684 RepID=UPI0020081718|nr:uncharacterized protein F5B22DRAFT_640008 [Xylaria bambusicola]KAI0505354.1 hypothetical protein F5B22DRAFT_640008 [Xylaria bambusicola]